MKNTNVDGKYIPGLIIILIKSIQITHRETTIELRYIFICCLSGENRMGN